MRQLRYFVGVCEAGSLLQASRRLHVAQPALGQQVSALEQELGARLFERSRRGMRLTEAGALFLEHARLILADAERARSAVRELASVPAGEVAVGLPTTVSLIASLPILQACRAELPQVRLKVVEAYSGFLGEWLEAGRLDVAVLMGDIHEAGLACEPLLVDRLVFVTGACGGALPRKLTLAQLADWPLILPGREHGLRRIIDRACAASLDGSLNVVAEMDALGSVKRAAEQGLGSTILPAGAVLAECEQGLLRMAEIDSALMDRRVVCATNVTRPSSSSGTAVTELVKRVLHTMVQDGRWPARWVGRVPG